MKCVTKNNTIRRVTDETALQLIKDGWQYSPKAPWKALPRAQRRQSYNTAVPLPAEVTNAQV